MPKATDPDVERIASGLMDYLRDACLSEHTMKFAICEALYEMRAIARGEIFHPTARVSVTQQPKPQH